MHSSGLPPFFFVLACTHKSTPIHIREYFALTKNNTQWLYQKIKSCPFFQECIILNTCNRVEIYGIATHPNPATIVGSLFCECQEIDSHTFTTHSFCYKNKDALNHLFEVACGVDSQILGEAEIFGQVKTAYQEAVKAHTVGPFLHKIFQKTFQATKYVRTYTDITKGNISIATITVDLALRIFENLSTASILLIGAGEVGEQTLKTLKTKGATNITIANRTLSNAQKLASKYCAQAKNLEDIETLILSSGIIIGSASIQEPIINKEILLKILKKRKNEPLFLVDLAIPRNFHSNCSELSNVYLYNLDDMTTIAQQNLNAREKEAHKCKNILQEKINILWPMLEESLKNYSVLKPIT